MAELDPDKREWEYDGTGAKIYKLEAGHPIKTPYTELDGGVPMKKEPYNFGAFSKLKTCGCGRSPIGKCVGWHSLSEVEYQTELEQMVEQMKQFQKHQTK